MNVIRLRLSFTDPELEPEAKEAEAQQLFNELKQMDEVETVERAVDSNPPEGSKALGATLVGLLTAEVSSANIKALFNYLGDRLGGKPIELEVEANGKKLKVTASSREELEAAVRAAQAFVAS